MLGGAPLAITRDMADHFSRRGFLKAAMAAGAGLCLPAIPALALDGALGARLEPFADSRWLSVDLYVRHEERTGIVLPANAIHFEGSLTVDGVVRSIVLRPENLRRIVSRAGGFRGELRAVTVPPAREVRYATFQAYWPEGIARGTTGELSVRAELDMAPWSRPREEREALRALGRVRTGAQVTIPA